MTKNSTNSILLTAIEVLAVISSILFTLLIQQGLASSWSLAILSSGLFLYLVWVKHLYAESLLHLFYIATAVYGWYMGGELLNNRLALQDNLFIALGGFIVVALSGFLLQKFSDAKIPFVDAFTTVFAIVGTMLMINAFADTWYYLLAINLVSIYLYFNRGLKLSALLYVVYSILAIRGIYLDIIL